MATTTKPEIGSKYQTGEVSPVDGEFACMKCEEAGSKNIITVSQGETFPICKPCKSAVTWRLERYL